MTTAYNLRNKLARSSNADRSARLDPGSGGVIVVSPVDRAVVECTGAGTRTLEDAIGVGLGTTILCLSQTAGVVITGAVSVTIGDGEFVEFVVTNNSSGVHQWVPKNSTKATVLTTAAVTNITGNTSSYVEATINLIVDCLVANGLATDSTTT